MSLGIPMTELEAVNAMLDDIGERPTTTLIVPTRRDVIRAQTTLNRVSRAVQIRGHWFNTQIVNISINGTSKYAVDASYVHLEVISGGPNSGTNGTPMLVQRDGFLFDVVNGTDVFPGASPVKCVVHKLLAYESCPASAREYIYAAASVRNQSQAFGSLNVSKELQQQAAQALALLNEEDLDALNLDQTFSKHFLQMMHLR